MTPHWSVIVLTQGTRPHDLASALDSVAAQRDVTLEVILVGNGWDPEGTIANAVTVHLQDNLGIPEGRNRGVERASGRYLYFLDDDALLPQDDALVRLQEGFESNPTLGVVQTRLSTPDGDSMRRWVPRMRDTDPFRSSEVFSVAEGALAVRADAFAAAGGLPGDFFYAHEGIELAWRAWDAGFRVEYRADVYAVHPRSEPSRHAKHAWFQGRNRVWLAKRNLPCPVGIAYVITWALVTMVRSAPHPSAAWGWLRGAAVGVRRNAGPRRPIAWRTVWLMTRRGRPPII